MTTIRKAWKFSPAAVLAAVLIGPIAIGAEPRARPASRLGASVHIWQALGVGGSVRVDETPVKGDSLSLAKDLGMDSWTELDAQISYRFNDRTLLRLAYGQFIYGGHAILPRDVFFNGVRLQGGSEVDVSGTDHFRVSLIVERELRGRIGGASVTLLGGLLYDSLSFHADARISPLSRRTETSENFRRQAMPLPMIGVRIKEQPLPLYTSFLEVSGLCLPPVATPFDEGGRITESESVLEAALGIQRRLGRAELSAAYRYRYCENKEVSNEDLNHVRIFSSGLEVGVEWEF